MLGMLREKLLHPLAVVTTAGHVRGLGLSHHGTGIGDTDAAAHHREAEDRPPHDEGVRGRGIEI